MAKTVKDDDPLVKLDEETRKHLEEMGSDIEKSEKDLEALEELGIDTSRLKERVEWAKKARDIVLNRLS